MLHDLLGINHTQQPTAAHGALQDGAAVEAQAAADIAAAAVGQTDAESAALDVSTLCYNVSSYFKV
jgi:hypothetical protein